MVANKDGRIVTFYSFKGGVGRTMAVANVALLAAMSGKRVLVMDWDLEAPGLSYYFRGLLDRSGGTSTEDGPGVLDFLCEWANALKAPLMDEEFEKLQARFTQGEPFHECVKNLIEPSLASTLLPAAGKLDFIGAGGRTIRCDPPALYEEVLAKFSWPDFFEERAGGFVLDNLRLWAKSKYDLVLIDSRTGLADVAGICTMLLPDTVALCFVLNQQNIDGVAKVAAAVRGEGGSDISLRAIPMKVARRESADASDAQARALKELTRVGGFTAVEALKDFKLLYVALEDNVPFYETLAPFASVDPSFDPLTLAYLRIANELFETKISMPTFPRDTINLVRRRLMPSNATVQYISELQMAEPSRAFSELDRLTESAIGTDTDGGVLEPEYISALFEATVDLVNRSDEPDEILTLQNRLLDLLRRLSRGDPRQWADVLILAIERKFEMIFLFDKDEEEVALLDEIDDVLASKLEPEYKFKRMNYKRRLARLLLGTGKIDDVGPLVDSISEIVYSIDVAELSESEKIALQDTRIDTQLLSGEVMETGKKIAKAIEYYYAGLEIADAIPTESSIRADMTFNLHYRLATILSGEAAIHHAVKAASLESPLAVRHFVNLGGVVLRSRTDVAEIIVFLKAVFGGKSPSKRMKFVSYFGRIPSRAVDFISVIGEFSKELAGINTVETIDVLTAVLNTSVLITKGAMARRQFLGKKGVRSLVEALTALLAIAETSHLPVETIRSLEQAIVALRQSVDVSNI